MKARVIVAAALAALLGCSDSTGPSGTNGTITFTFAGGTFTVSAAAPAEGSAPSNTNMAAGAIDASVGQTYVMGAKALGGDAYDFLVIGMSRTTVGTSPVEADCDPEGDTCSGLVFMQNFGGESFGTMCALSTGTLAITEVTSTRVKGTFSGTGLCINDLEEESPFTVTNGTFNVALTAAIL
jgi:hypothetical protein